MTPMVPDIPPFWAFSPAGKCEVIFARSLTTMMKESDIHEQVGTGWQ
jgi:hypothetical protein